MADKYNLKYAPPARRALTATLPETVVAAAWELINGGIADNPRRVGKPLHEPYAGRHSVRRGTYRVIYRIDEETHTVTIEAIEHRWAAYRP